VPPLSAEQLAAFQAAYMKALQEQSVLLARATAGVAQPGAAGLPPALLQGALSPLGTLQGVTVEGSVNGTVANGAMATVGQQLQLQPPPPQQQQRAPLQAVLRGGAAALAAGVAPDGEEADEATDGTVLATSCAHGPLVTHPHMSTASGMLVSVFPSSNESWLYVLMNGEFGVPFEIGVSDKGVIYGKLQFRQKMQQWVLLQVEPHEWQSLQLESPFGRAKAVAPTAAPLYEAVRGAAARGGAAATQASRTRARLREARAAGKRRTAAAARRKTGAAEVGATAAAE